MRKSGCCQVGVPTHNSHSYCTVFNALKFWCAVYSENDESDTLQKTSWLAIYLFIYFILKTSRHTA